MQVAERIMRLSNEFEAHTLKIRQAIHRHPELAFQEFETSKLVCKELERIGIPYERSLCEPGVIGVIDSGKPGKFLMLRADMDALPVQELTGLAYASEVPNVMHACGHDVHTSNLLAVGEILNNTKDSWKGRVKLVFQPAEEVGGDSGGKQMIRHGLMDQVPDACFALHVDNNEPGEIVASTGYISAYTDSYHIAINGKAAHSSAPQEGVDAIHIAAAIVTALNGIVSKNISPMANSTLNIGVIRGGTAENIVADHVEMQCMFRNLTPDARMAMIERIEGLCKGISMAMGGSCDLNLTEGYPSVLNNELFTKFVASTIKTHANELYEGITDGVPEGYLVTGQRPLLAGEDFGFYSQIAPACLIWVSTGGRASKHNPEFFVDEKYIKLCTRTMAMVAVDFLK
jgi:amidohydrolase